MSPPPPSPPRARRPPLPPPPPLSVLPPPPPPPAAAGAVKPRPGSAGRRAGPSGQAQCELPAPPGRAACAAPAPSPRAQARTGGRWRRAGSRRPRGCGPGLSPQGGLARPHAAPPPVSPRRLHPEGRENPRRRLHSCGLSRRPADPPALACPRRAAGERPGLDEAFGLEAAASSGQRCPPSARSGPRRRGGRSGPGLSGQAGQSLGATSPGCAAPRPPQRPARAGPGGRCLQGGRRAPRAAPGHVRASAAGGSLSQAETRPRPAGPRAPRPRRAVGRPGAGPPGCGGGGAAHRAGKEATGTLAATARCAGGARA